MAGGVVWFAGLFGVFYAAIYGATMREEHVVLEGAFGDAYREYVNHVPTLVPRITPYRSPTGGDAPFSLQRYLRHKEWEALLGCLVGFSLLAAKMIWWG